MSTEEVPTNKTEEVEGMSIAGTYFESMLIRAAISTVIQRTERMEVRQKTTKKRLATLESSKLKAEFEIEKLQIEVKHLQTQVADLKKGTLPNNFNSSIYQN